MAEFPRLWVNFSRGMVTVHREHVPRLNLIEYVPAAELARVKAGLDEARANYQFMVERACDEKLDGYRELGAKAAAAENALDTARARIAELEGVVRRQGHPTAAEYEHAVELLAEQAERIAELESSGARLRDALCRVVETTGGDPTDLRDETVMDLAVVRTTRAVEDRDEARRELRAAEWIRKNAPTCEPFPGGVRWREMNTWTGVVTETAWASYSEAALALGWEDDDGH